MIAEAAPRPEGRLLRLILAVDAVVVLLHVVTRLAGIDKRFFDLDLEQNLPTWVSSMQFFGVGICAGLLSIAAAGRQRLAWRVFAAIFVFLSLDELASIHEELVDRIATSPTGDAWFWPLFYVPLGAGALAAVFTVVGDVRRLGGSVRSVLASLALLGTSLLLDGAAATFVDEPVLYEPELVLEEAFELVGTGVLIAVLLGMFLCRPSVRRA